MRAIPQLVLFLLGLCISFAAFSQDVKSGFDPLYPPNTYQHVDNHLYWKHKPPYEGYWQQDVHYTINARLDDTNDELKADMVLHYWNNSPDTLSFVYFHLYQNAFQPDSYYDELVKANGKKPLYGKHEAAGNGTKVHDLIQVTTGQQRPAKVNFEVDNTILKATLNEPLAPGSFATFNISFSTWFDRGSEERRMAIFNAFGNKHYNGVHWYPRISVYDRKFGWTTDQHMGKEFYGDFGTFDVTLDLPAHYILDATGNLLNEAEVMPAELRQKLDVSNFAEKPWGSKPSVIIPPSDARKSWKFHAENVHDFAWTADPTYRIGEADWNGVRCISLVQEPHAAYWQNAASYTAKIVEVFSRDFGTYEYPKMIVADARDGMEYPMLTLDGGYDPWYRSLLVHEVGHNWFFGMLGNNETYRAWMDEGFTQFLTAWGLEKIDGPYEVIEEPNSGYERRFSEQRDVWDANAYNWYLEDAMRNRDAYLNTHSDGFNGALGHGGGYGHVYDKTAVMLRNLEYVLGDELFLKAMQHYVAQWKIAHPYPEDFRNSVIQFTGADLNWFFDQWLETNKHIDYKLKSVRKQENGLYTLKLKRKGQMQMPLDLRVYTKAGDSIDLHVPNTWFEKKTNAAVLPRWIGWDKLNEVYETDISVPAGIDRVVIDPSRRLADVNQLNNGQAKKVRLRFDSGIRTPLDRDQYRMYWMPLLWYNNFDGIKPGLRLRGDHMEERHIFDLRLWYAPQLLTGGYNSQLNMPDTPHLPISFNLKYRTATDRFLKNSNSYFGGGFQAGLAHVKLGLDKRTPNGDRLDFYVKGLWRTKQQDAGGDYPIYPQEWSYEQRNLSFNVNYRHDYRYPKGRGRIETGLRTNMLFSEFDFSRLQFTVTNETKLGGTALRSRVFAQIGTGQNIPNESKLFLAGANPEDMFDVPAARSRGIFPNSWTSSFGSESNHFHQGGGLNLRGYAGYLSTYLEEEGQEEPSQIYKGTSGASINLEYDFLHDLRFSTFSFNAYLFADAGIIHFEGQNGRTFSDIRSDAGVGASLTLRRIGNLRNMRPLTVRFDAPVFLSNEPFGSTDGNFAFRYVVGVNRAF